MTDAVFATLAEVPLREMADWLDDRTKSYQSTFACIMGEQV